MWEAYSSFMNDLPGWVSILIWVGVVSSITVSLFRVGLALWIRGRDVANAVDASESAKVKEMNKNTKPRKNRV